ncbi:MAG: hypothetical protein IPK06_14035 [Ignavibacteriae bacterium]|nr:hypothetical protein [Ignavibacteriota bacterium]
MQNYIELKTLKNAELLLRFCMMVTLIIAGISKFCSHGSFHDYYLLLFTKDSLRIQLPSIIYNIALTIIPYIEILIGMGLFLTKYRLVFIVIWVFYFIFLEVGHYILEEWLSVDAMIPFVLLGVAAYILPAHEKLKNILTS